MRWLGLRDGRQPIDQQGAALTHVREGYRATFTITTTMRIDMCKGEINGYHVAPDDVCDKVILTLPPDDYTVQSPGLENGGFAVRRPEDLPCAGLCWRVYRDTEFMDWDGPTSGPEWIQQAGFPLEKLRSGYTARFSTSVSAETDICTGTIDGRFIADENTCTPTTLVLGTGPHTAVSKGRHGGFAVRLPPSSG